jgi:hypothetical protein
MKHAHAWNWDGKGGTNCCYKHNQQKPSARALLQRNGKICKDIESCYYQKGFA